MSAHREYDLQGGRDLSCCGGFPKNRNDSFPFRCSKSDWSGDRKESSRGAVTIHPSPPVTFSPCFVFFDSSSCPHITLSQWHTSPLPFARALPLLAIGCGACVLSPFSRAWIAMSTCTNKLRNSHFQIVFRVDVVCVAAPPCDAVVPPPGIPFNMRPILVGLGSLLILLLAVSLPFTAQARELSAQQQVDRVEEDGA